MINDTGFPFLLMILYSFLCTETDLVLKKNKEKVGSPFKIQIKEGTTQIAQNSEPAGVWETQVKRAESRA